METTTVSKVQEHFRHAKEVVTASYFEEINLLDYDFESIHEHGNGNYYIIHKDDLKLSSSNFTKRVKCLFDKKRGFAEIITKI